MMDAFEVRRAEARFKMASKCPERNHKLRGLCLHLSWYYLFVAAWENF